MSRRNSVSFAAGGVIAAIGGLKLMQAREPVSDEGKVMIAATSAEGLAARLLASLTQAPTTADKVLLVTAAIEDIRAAEAFKPLRACSVCGCTEDRACVTDGQVCGWAGPLLCTACADKGTPS